MWQAARDVGLVLRQRLGENVAPVPAVDVVEIVGSSTDGARPPATAGPGLAIGVGGSPACTYVLYGESIFRSANESSRLVLGQRVFDRRVHLQRHLQPQPIVDHAGDLRAIGFALGLALDQRRDRHRLRDA